MGKFDENYASNDYPIVNRTSCTQDALIKRLRHNFRPKNIRRTHARTDAEGYRNTFARRN